MSKPYEEMRSYIWKHDWRPIPMIEKGKRTIGWRNDPNNRYCQDIEEAYAVTKLRVEVMQKWKQKKT